MGRSKFPGKPSKHTNKKRIHVLPANGEPTCSNSTNNIDGSVTVENTIAENNKQKQDERLCEKRNSEKGSESGGDATKKRIADKAVECGSAGPGHVLKGRLATVNQNNKNNANAPTKRQMQVLRSKSGKKKRSLLKSRNKLGGKCTRASTNGSKSQKEALVGKFVLPTRSVHSSRVIKPNKRFLNVDLNDSITSLKKKVVKRHLITAQQTNGKNKDSAENVEVKSTGKVVIRQARLKLMPSSSPTSSKNNVGPFSSNHLSNNHPGTITCGVCGAVRFYRFVKQARKFNIYSCESCRKFISKMIKRQKCGKSFTTLVCHKGQGMCHVPPIVRSQHWKLLRCAYASRCPACWLKMCLRSFQIPSSLKQNLLQLLPKNMQGSEVIFSNSLPPLIWPNPASHSHNNNNNSSSSSSSNNNNNSNSSVVNMKELKENLNALATNQSNSFPTTSSMATTKQQRPVRKANVPVVKAAIPNCDIKRQKIDLKGPRVKHVCRSASIVLGQPLATFSTDKDTQEQLNDNKPITNSDSNSSSSAINEVAAAAAAAATALVKEKVDKDRAKCESNLNNNTPTFSETDSSDSDKISKMHYLINEATVSSVKRREKSQKYLQEMKINAERKMNIESLNNISIDFWEGYDPENVCQNGFCLISSEPFPMPAICFLCGSAGRESLIYCSLCCEPYHCFCLEQTQQWNNNNDNIWLCPRCTTCAECNQPDRQKINCQKCLKSYHPECFNKKWNGNRDDKPTVCFKCLRCKSCGSENITKFVGNLPLCLNCFKLRKKGNFCPVCQHCYDDNECCSKMMECAKCNKWVHAKCDKLSEEQYQILSVLPESVEYFCKSCSTESTPNWRQAIDLEFQTNCNQVLRMLSKNKTARNMLKWSPLSNHTPSNRAISNSRRLQFDDNNYDIDNNNYNCSKDITDINKIYSFEENEKMLENESKITFTMVDIKNKLNSNEYNSVAEFNKDMEEALRAAKSEELIKIYQSIFHSVFPWFVEVREERSTTKIVDQPLNENAHKSPITKYDKPPQIDYALEDSRICTFCKAFGDGLSCEESRLLHCGQNEWVHANCALWSSEVYEEIDGSLQNVHSALNRGRLIRCAVCKQKGASVGCCFKGCYETYHFLCARRAKCHFLHDKTVYCSIHELARGAHVLTSPLDFQIHRSVYVELDKKKRKFSDIDKVNFMVGSLLVRHLGKIHPIISDTPDAIIPLGFVCTRLFWSTVEPWKLIQYTITTSMMHTNTNSMFIDKNFTIDHTLPKAAIDKMLRELSVWQKDIDRKRSSEIIEFEDDEEPQNGADLLSPELTDAILEELPHDLLDGISVQDIFPKFMSYDELINMDFKTDTTMTNHSTDVPSDEERNGRELRRSKSEVISTTPHVPTGKSSNRAAQRSCSLTLSCKVDSAALPPAIKKRKMVATRDNNMFFQLLQVDGGFDESSSSECDSPTGGRAADQNLWKLEEPVTCEKCQRTYRTQASYKRHLDACEVICSSESDSEVIDESNGIDDGAGANQTVLFESTFHQNEISVLNTQTFVSKSTELLAMHDGKSVVPINSVAPLSVSSQSGTETAEFTLNHPITLNDQTQQFCVNSTVPLCVNQSLTIQPNSIINNNPYQLSLNQGSIALNQGTVALNQCQGQVSLNQGALSLNQLKQGSIALNQGTTVSLNPAGTVSLSQPVTINQGIINSMPLNQSIDLNQQSVTLPFSNTVTPILNVTPTITFNGKIINPIIPTVNTVNVNPTQSQWLKPIKPLVTQKSVKRPNRSRTIAAKRTHFDSGDAIITLPAATATNQTTPVIVQHLPSTNFMPFVDASSFQQQQQQQQHQQQPHHHQQQQPTQNVQYIIPQATISQPLIQLQDNNVINLVPGIQPTMFIQQQQNQLVLDSNGSLGWASTPTVQPVYYGFETIVQNTVMQSQQFLPTTMPGVLTANSSYSTTTQVFQTSKLEPVLDVASNSFVLVSNSGQLVNNSPAAAATAAAPTVPPTNIDVPPQQYSQATPHLQTSSHSHSHSHSQPINILAQKQELKYSSQSNKSQNTANHHIQLPKTPFVQEQRIPTNIVTPTPKPLTCVQNQNHRPMNRVLPMPTMKGKKCADEKLFDEAMKKSIIDDKDIKIEKIKLLSVVKIQEESKKAAKEKDKDLGTKIVSAAPVSMPSYSRTVSFLTNSIPVSLATLNSTQLTIPTITPVVTTHKSINLITTSSAKTSITGNSVPKATSKAVTVTPIPVTKSEPRSMPILFTTSCSPRPSNPKSINSFSNLNNSVSLHSNTCHSSSKSSSSINSVSTVNSPLHLVNSLPSISNSLSNENTKLTVNSSMKWKGSVNSLPSTSLSSSAIPSAAISLAATNPVAVNTFSSVKSSLAENSLSWMTKQPIKDSTNTQISEADSLFNANSSSSSNNLSKTSSNPLSTFQNLKYTNNTSSHFISDTNLNAPLKHSTPVTVPSSISSSIVTPATMASIISSKGQITLHKAPSVITASALSMPLLSTVSRPSSSESIQKKSSPTVLEKLQEKENQANVKGDTSLKLVFQKQGQDGTYKVSNNFSFNTSSAKQPLVAPLKPIKSNNAFFEKSKSEESVSHKGVVSNPPTNKKDESSILYTIETQDGFKYTSTSVADLWDKVLEAVQSARAAHNMPPLPAANEGAFMNSLQILGLKSSGLKYLIEQMPGASKCHKYKPAYNFPPHVLEVDDEYSMSHMHGAIRCCSYDKKKHYDMFGWLASKHRKLEEVAIDTIDLLPRRGSVTNLPMAMRFRQLKLTSKYSVGVYRSNIHGRGLFCLRDIEAGEMVIEYAGEVIRSILTDKREKYYNSKGIGCYMFRVDDNFVVDATMKGNAARFINHSCDPNCYSKVVEILGHKHIIIFALRRILCGEELTYDYKFPFEEDKIPCTCGARKCRKFLN